MNHAHIYFSLMMLDRLVLSREGWEQGEGHPEHRVLLQLLLALPRPSHMNINKCCDHGDVIIIMSRLLGGYNTPD